MSPGEKGLLGPGGGPADEGVGVLERGLAAHAGADEELAHLAPQPHGVGDDRAEVDVVGHAVERAAERDQRARVDWHVGVLGIVDVDLETTFRCSDRIAALATDFVLRNPAQIRKTVRATRKAERTAVHVGLPGGQGLALLKETLDRIAEDAGRYEGISEVLLLGRYRHLRPLNLESLAKQYPRLRLSFMTVHRAKGLEADYAVVLGLCAGKLGFPVEIADDPMLDLVLSAPEEHPNAEERRLLYVALTRARRLVFLLAEGGAPSGFVTELIDGEYDVTVFGRPPEGAVACPECKEGGLERRENPRDRGVFYGCSNWPYCEQTVRPCPKCGTGLPVRSGDAFRCRDCGGSIEGCPSCGGWLETRMGRYGRFLGCSNYPDCDYTRNLRRPRTRA